MRDSNEVEVRVRGIGSGGVGVADLPDGRILFVPRTAPGDLVRVRVVQERGRWAKGELVSILSSAPGRREPPCTRYGECDGCTLQHLDYSEQRFWKGRIVGDALRRIGKVDVEDPVVEPAPEELLYRNKVSVTLRRLPGGRVVAGFHERATRHRILDVGPECQLLEPGLAHLWEALRSEWGPGANRLPLGRQLRLTLRRLEEFGVLVIQGGRGEGRPSELMAAIPGLASIWREDTSGKLSLLKGKQTLQVSWLRERFKVMGGTFVQVNSKAGEALHRFVLASLGEIQGKRIVDGYCGMGVLGREMAHRGASVVGIEADPHGFAAAERDAPEGFRVVHGRVEEILPEELPADLVLLNPPREGVDARVSQVLAQEPVGRIIYVSCDPATLARDIGRLGGRYQLVDLHSFDLFPQTSHVETVAALVRKES